MLVNILDLIIRISNKLAFKTSSFGKDRFLSLIEIILSDIENFDEWLGL